MSTVAAQDQKSKQARSVEHLQELYTVVVALALTLMVEGLIPAAGIGFERRPVGLAVALLITLIPFYHGALRHLDDQYAEADAHPPRPFGVLVDFLLLFLESVVFLALATSLDKPRVFAVLFCALLVLDIAWSYVTTEFLAREGADMNAQKAWRHINLVSVALLLGFLLVVSFTDWLSMESLWYAIPGIAVARTVADYSITWRFYTAARG